MKRRIVITLALAMLFTLCACGQKALTWQEQYDLGVRYLSDGNYEEVIIAFTAAIEIDAKRSEAYEGRADAYVGASKADADNVDILLLAKQDYSQAYELNPVDSIALKMQTVFERVIDFYYGRNEIEIAGSYYEEMLPWMNDQSIPDRWGFETEDTVDIPENEADIHDENDDAAVESEDTTEQPTEQQIGESSLFTAADFLEALDGNSWHFIDSVSGSKFVFGFTFNGNGSGTYYYGYPFSETLGEGTMNYSVEGNRLSLNLSEGVSAIYRLDFVGDYLLMIQDSPKGLFAHHGKGYELVFVPRLYADWNEVYY